MALCALLLWLQSVLQLALPCLAGYMLHCGPDSKGSTVYGKPPSVETLGWPGTHTPTDRPTWHFSLLPHPTTTPPLTIACTEASPCSQALVSDAKAIDACFTPCDVGGRPERVLQCDAVRDVCRTIVWECPHEINEACAWPMAATRSGFGRNARSPWPAEYSPSTHHGLQSTHQVLVDSDMKSHDRFDCRPDRRQSTAV